jgi:D-aspartate ligase
MSEPRRLHILILDDGRQCLPFMRSLKRAGHRVVLACGSKLSTGYCSRYPDRRLMWTDYFHDLDGFTSRMFEYLRRHRPDVTLALGDMSAGIVARHHAEMLRYTTVTIPDWPVFDIANDKARTMAFCMANRIPCPQTYPVGPDDLDAVAARIPFPVMVKPARGIGAVGLHRFDAPDVLKRHYQSLHQQYGDLVVQEFIPLEGGTQFQAEAFVGRDCRMKVCVVISKPRFFPVTGGTSTANMTIHRPDIQETVRALLEGIGWSGAADVDLILDPRDNIPKVLEINPRVTAGIKIGFAAGVDYADLHIRLATGRPIPAIPSYKLGVYSRNICMDLLWYLYSTPAARRSTELPFFRIVGHDICDQVLALDDPLPFAGFILGMLKKYAAPSAWKTKLGRDLR